MNYKGPRQASPKSSSRRQTLGRERPVGKQLAVSVLGSDLRCAAPAVRAAESTNSGRVSLTERDSARYLGAFECLNYVGLGD